SRRTLRAMSHPRIAAAPPSRRIGPRTQGRPSRRPGALPTTSPAGATGDQKAMKSAARTIRGIRQSSPVTEGLKHREGGRGPTRGRSPSVRSGPFEDEPGEEVRVAVPFHFERELEDEGGPILRVVPDDRRGLGPVLGREQE